ncbi:MAG: hypothetical protein IJ862_07135 [Selenomonadaceae bacterium]|nr:hypothetical protein [Selenomonadaceae bacterium]
MSTINNSKNNTIISGTANADSIWNKGDNVTINANGGNDTIRNGFEYSHTYDNSYVVINAGDGKDEIWNTDSYVTINGGAGDDSLDFSGGHIKAYGGAGNDTVNFWCAEENDSLLTNNYLDGGEGNNIINAWSGGHNFTINAGSGDDEIFSSASNSTINAGNGNNYVVISERWMNDSVVGSIENILVNTGSGRDSIETHSADNSTINTGDGNDNVWNFSQNTIINLGAGNDFAANDYWIQSNVVINGEDGNDILMSSSSYTTINGGSGKDTIYSNKDKILTNGGADNDVIISGHWGPEIIYHDTYTEEKESLDIAATILDTSEGAINISKGTIKGGKGNDTIAISSKSSMNVVQYANGDGNDVVYGYTSMDTIHITSGNYTTQISGDDVIINVGTGSVKLKNTKGIKLNIKGTYSGSSTTTTTSTLNITNSYKSPITVDSGVKNINASNRTTAVKITGNSLANSIKGGKGNNTLVGGKGNDTLTGGSGKNVFQYANGDGSDVITNYGNNDTIEITDGIYSTQTSGNDVIVKVDNGSITLKNAKGKTLNIAGNVSSKVSVASGAVTYNGHSYKLYTLGKTWDEAKTYCENLGGHLVAVNTSAEQSFVESMIRNGSKSSYWLGGYKDSSSNWHWVTNEIFGYTNWAIGEPNNGEEGEDKLMIFKNPDPKNPAAKFGDWNDLAADCAEGAWPASIYGTSSFGFICEWDTITGSPGSSSSVTLTNSNSASYTADSSIKNINASTRTAAIKIAGNSLANSIVGGSGADSLSGGGGADTLNGGKGNDTLTGGAGKDVFFFASSEGNDVITDYSATQGDLIRLGTSSISTSTSGNNVILTVGTGKVTINNAKSQKVSVVGSDSKTTVIGGTSSTTTLTVTNSDKSPVTVGSAIKTINASSRTTAVQITGNALDNTIRGGSGSSTIYGGAGNDSILSGGGDDKIFGEAGNDTIYGGRGNNSILGGDGDDRLYGDVNEDTIRGGAGNDYIYGGDSYAKDKLYGDAGNDTIYGSRSDDSLFGGDGDDKLYGSSGKDTLNGGKGNDTLSGGGGMDVFYFEANEGNDVITDYTAYSDLIRLGVSSMSTSVSGDDVILTVGTGKITVKNIKDLHVSVVGANGNTTVIGGPDTLNVTNSSRSSITAPWNTKTVDASKRTTGVRIVANSLNNTIIGGSGSDTIYGESGSDSILGNAGDDSLFGGDNPDTIRGGAGNDYISGESGNNRLFGDAGDDSVYGSGYLSGGTGNDKLFGNYTSDSLDGGDGNDSLKGAGGNDTLIGGKGNDTLTGNDGDDVFVYANGDGNDVITDYNANDDKLRITGSYSTVTSGNDVIVNVGSGSITLKNANGKKLNITKVSNYDERWFLEDDDYIDSTQLDSIMQTTDNSYSVGNVSSTELTSNLAKTTNSILNLTQNVKQSTLK